MNENLYMQQWNKIDKNEKIIHIEEMLKNRNIPLKIDRIETFSQNNMAIETIVLKDENSEFVFVPGMENVTLGWDKNCLLSDEVIHDLKEDKTKEIEYYKSEYNEIKKEYGEDIENAEKNGDKEKVQSLTEEMEDELENYEEYFNVNLDEYIEGKRQKIHV